MRVATHGKINNLSWTEFWRRIDDELQGGGGADVLVGGRDTLDGDAGNDLLRGDNLPDDYVNYFLEYPGVVSIVPCHTNSKFVQLATM